MAISKKINATTLGRSWGWLLGLGVLFILLGVWALKMVVGVTLVSILFLGVLFEIAGIAQLIDTFKSKQWRASAGHGLIALFYMAMGALIIFDPIMASSIITLLLACLLIIIGITRFIMAVSLHSHTAGWFFLLIGGIAAILFGVLIIAHWPISGLWVIGLFISIELIVTGWTYVFLAITMRKGQTLTR